MKKLVALFAFFILLGSLVACSINSSNDSAENDNSKNQTSTNNKKSHFNENKEPNPTTEPSKENKEPKPIAETIKDYYPLKKNTRYIYDGVGNEFASYDVYNDYISGDRVQQRINNGGTTMANVLELKGDKLTKVFSRGEVYYRENLLKTNSAEKEIMLMEPLEKGTTWTLKDGRVRTITNTAVDLTTPTGNYKAVEVTTKSAHDKTMDYYAKNVGLVKSVFVSGDTEVTSTLSKIEENVPLIQDITFYYPNINDGKIYYQRKKINFYTNEITRKVFAKAYKQPVNNQVGVVFSKNTEINSLYLNKDGNVYVDLNQAFIKEMTAGAQYEEMMVQSVVNTIGQYYQAEKVFLTIDNKPYESGHIKMKKGEYFKVQTKDTIEIK